jgi:hypothetical protein
MVRLGELLKAMPKAGGPGVPGPGRGKTGSRSELVFGIPTNNELGLSKKISAAAQKLAGFDKSDQEAIAKRQTTISEVRRKQKVIEMRKIVALPTAKFQRARTTLPITYA